MPLPTDISTTQRTFRKCASDPVGSWYQSSTFLASGHLWTLSIYRGNESLVAFLSNDVKQKSAKSLEPLFKRHPVFHGGIKFGWRSEHDWAPCPAFLGPDTQRPIIGWSYDCFGDVPFSSLKRGAYRPDPEVSTEWGVQDVLSDSIDEVRRVVGISIEVEKPASRVVPGKKLVRRILL